MDDERVELYVMGISYSPLQSGAFALLMGEVGGKYRIPIVVGAAEAQSIAIQIERIVTPRPITHDLFCSFSHAFSIELQDVFIYKFEDGIFSSEMTFTDGEREVKIDSRTSDAIAIALRMGAPIYTTRDILHRTGTVFKNDEDTEKDTVSEPEADSTSTADTESMSVEELEAALSRFIEEENYEEAAKISEILKKRNNEEH